jgi:hypothetical protein
VFFGDGQQAAFHQVVQLTPQLSGASIWVHRLDQRQQGGIRHRLRADGINVLKAGPSNVLAPFALLRDGER